MRRQRCLENSRHSPPIHHSSQLWPYPPLTSFSQWFLYGSQLAGHSALSALVSFVLFLSFSASWFILTSAPPQHSLTECRLEVVHARAGWMHACRHAGLLTTQAANELQSGSFFPHMLALAVCSRCCIGGTFWNMGLVPQLISWTTSLSPFFLASQFSLELSYCCLPLKLPPVL